MSTRTETPAKRKMNKHETDTMIQMIIEAIIKNDTLRARVLLSRVSTMTKINQGKVLRGVLNFFLLKKNSFIYNSWRNLRQDFNLSARSFDYNGVRLILLERLIRVLQKLEEQGSFEPRKITTINTLTKDMLSIDSQLFSYIFDNGIVQFGKSVKISNINRSVAMDATIYGGYLDRTALNLDNIKNFLEAYGINPKTYMNPSLKRLVKVNNFVKNISLVNKLVKNDWSIPKLTDLHKILEVEKNANFYADIELAKTSPSNWQYNMSALQSSYGCEMLPEDVSKKERFKLVKKIGEIQQELNEVLSTKVEEAQASVEGQKDFSDYEKDFDLKRKIA